MSADLQWALLRGGNSFVVKRDNTLFSKEPGNLMNKHSFKFSGLANNKTVGFKVAENPVPKGARKSKGKKEKQRVVIMTTKDAGCNRFPKRALRSMALTHHMRNHTCAGAEAVITATRKSSYRADLTKFAVARYHALRRSIAIKPKVAKAKKLRGAKAAKAAAAAAAKH